MPDTLQAKHPFQHANAGLACPKILTCPARLPALQLAALQCACNATCLPCNSPALPCPGVVDGAPVRHPRIVCRHHAAAVLPPHPGRHFR